MHACTHAEACGRACGAGYNAAKLKALACFWELLSLIILADVGVVLLLVDLLHGVLPPNRQDAVNKLRQRQN